MQQLTFAAIWTDLTTTDRELLAEHFKCSIPILALKVIPEYMQSAADYNCQCSRCHVGRLFRELVGSKCKT